MRDLGVRPGQRVLLALSDSVEWVAAWYAAQKIGATTAEVYTFLQPKDYAYYLDYTDAPVILVDEVTLAAIREAQALTESHTPRQLLVLGATADLRENERPLDTLVTDASPELDAVPLSDDDTAIWKFTTGSTGAPQPTTLHGPVEKPITPAKTPSVLPPRPRLGALGTVRP